MPKSKPDHVYVIQPNTDVAIVDGVLSVTPRPDARRPHYPVDHFLRSLAAVQGSHAVGVILSGTGSDGTLGLCEIKAAGGVTFAQTKSPPQHAGMPQSAVAAAPSIWRCRPLRSLRASPDLRSIPICRTTGARRNARSTTRSSSGA